MNKMRLPRRIQLPNDGKSFGDSLFVPETKDVKNHPPAATSKLARVRSFATNEGL